LRSPTFKTFGPVTIMRALAIIVVFFNVSVSAQVFNGNELHDGCRAGSALVNGYVAGVLDKAFEDNLALEAYSRERPLSLDERVGQAIDRASVRIKNFCPPKGVTIAQAKDVTCKYLADNPSKRHLPAAQLVHDASISAWPCKH
jgi:hypothetical protein